MRKRKPAELAVVIVSRKNLVGLDELEEYEQLEALVAENQGNGKCKVDLREGETPCPDTRRFKSRRTRLPINLDLSKRQVKSIVEAEIFSPKLFEDAPEVELIDFLTSLTDNFYFDKPVDRSPFEVGLPFYIVLSEAYLDPDSEGFLQGHFKFNSQPLPDPGDNDQISKALSHIAQAHWPHVWPGLRRQNITRQRSYSADDYLENLYPFIPNVASMCLEGGIFIV